jgi:hypothetical protein
MKLMRVRTAGPACEDEPDLEVDDNHDAIDGKNVEKADRKFQTKWLSFYNWAVLTRINFIAVNFRERNEEFLEFNMKTKMKFLILVLSFILVY